MDKSRIMILLTALELDALLRMAKEGCRHPREQARFIIRTEAQRRGLLTENQKCEDRDMEID